MSVDLRDKVNSIITRGKSIVFGQDDMLEAIIAALE